MTLNDANPNWVATTSAGTYTATAWVRSDTGTGRPRCGSGSTRAAAWCAGRQRGDPEPDVAAVTSAMSPQAPGSSYLDLKVSVSGAPAGTNLYVDDVVLNRQ